MKLTELLTAIEGEYQLIGEILPEMEVFFITDNSTKVSKQSLFVAQIGTHQDGHLFLQEAVLNGAICVLVEKSTTLCIPQIVVNSTRDCARRLAEKLYNYPAIGLVMCGVTGTNGKTTTAFCLEQILLQAYQGHVGLLGTIVYRDSLKTWPSMLTTPGTLELQQLLHEMQSDGALAVVMEVSSHALSQERVRGILYDVAGFTNLSQDHLDFHQSMESYFLAKKKLFFDYVKSQAISIVCIDNHYGDRLYQELKIAGRLVYSVSTKISAPADIRVLSMESSIQGMNFTLHTWKGTLHIESGLIGRHNLENLVVAIGMALGINVPLPAIIQGIKQLQGVPGRLERVTLEEKTNGALSQITPSVFIDYAHTPDALARVLKTLAEYKPCNGKIFVVFGCGGDRDTSKRPLMGIEAGLGADVVVITSDNPRSEDAGFIAKQIEQGVKYHKGQIVIEEDASLEFGSGYCVMLDRYQAIRWAILHAKREDVVLVAGKGHETYQQIGQVKHPFSDQQACLTILKEKEQGAL